jgi:RNA polymerase sigma factor (TIGR02999 family)
MSDITLMLQAVERGEKKASEDLLPTVYEELRRLAAARMAFEAAGHTLRPTALVHEAWLQLVGGGARSWQNRAPFFGAAADAMRRILTDKARRKSRPKHGGGQVRVDSAATPIKIAL